MTSASAIQGLLDYVSELGPAISLAPFLAAVVCVYLMLTNDHDRQRARAYAIAAVTFFSMAIFIFADMGDIDFSRLLALFGLQ